MKLKFLLAVLLYLYLIWNCEIQAQEKIAYVSEKNTFAEQIIFPTQPEHVHGPTIVELSNGDLLAAWFQGSGERWADDVRIMGARLKVGEKQWSATFIMADVPGFPDVNPMLFVDQQNRLWLMWYTVLANQWETSLLKYRISDNPEGKAAPAWSWQEDLHMKPGDKTERGIQPNDRFVASVHEQMEGYEQYFKDTILTQLSQEKAEAQLQSWENYKAKLDSLARGKNMLRSGRIYKGDAYTAEDLGYPISRRIGW